MSVRAYVATWAALVALAAASFGLSFLHLGGWAMPAAVAIAAAKALLVALFFMHLVRAQASVRLAGAAAVVFIAILIGLVVADVVTRDGPALVPPVDREG